ncbi:hypothetical protein F4823DRAFT_573608 [Ustulina deusta]|nr:hypothetical protein F4823DRAFT_573608 [Ustulina deusta]
MFIVWSIPFQGPKTTKFAQLLLMVSSTYLSMYLTVITKKGGLGTHIIESYPWLDLSLESDTNGSLRKPAHYNGCFTICPSTGIMNTGVVIGQLP